MKMKNIVAAIISPGCRNLEGGVGNVLSYLHPLPAELKELQAKLAQLVNIFTDMTEKIYTCKSTPPINRK